MPTVKKKRKKKSKIYFGTPVHDAIVAYNRSEDYTFRHKIYTDEIHPAFLKLAENIINTFKFSYFDYGFRDLQEEVVSNLVKNDINCISYKAAINKSGKKEVKDINLLYEKIKFYFESEEKLEVLAKNWRKEISNNGH